MDEWVVDRPHHNRLCGIVRESGESKPKRRRLLAPRAWIYDGARGRWDVDAAVDHGQDRP
jgi:hypothetical protein